jgi:hypothetical protein
MDKRISGEIITIEYVKAATLAGIAAQVASVRITPAKRQHGVTYSL